MYPIIKISHVIKTTDLKENDHRFHKNCLSQSWADTRPAVTEAKHYPQQYRESLTPSPPHHSQERKENMDFFQSLGNPLHKLLNRCNLNFNNKIFLDCLLPCTQFKRAYSIIADLHIIKVQLFPPS